MIVSMKKYLIRSTAFAAVTFGLLSCFGGDKAPKEELPIMAWYSIPSDETTVERYQELKDCGFNINFTHMYGMGELKKELDVAAEVGIKVMAMANDLYTKTDSAVNVIKDHPALYGYFLRDEPLPPAFADLAAWAQRIKEADDTHAIYLNLVPSYVDSAALGCTYREYVRRFIEEVKLPMVSFDNYPVTNEGVRQLWYENLMIIAEESEKAGLPFWAFAMSVPHWNYPVPTLASLRMQMYTNLAYGAQGLQYFTYWTPGPEPFNYRDAPITLDGKRSEQYYKVQEVNRELQARAFVFVGSKVVSLAHTGETVPPGCPALEQLPSHVKSLSTSPEGAVVSLLEKGEWNYLVVVSRSLDTPISLNVGFDRKAWMIDREGNATKVAKGENSFTLEEGDAAIFKFRK